MRWNTPLVAEWRPVARSARPPAVPVGIGSSLQDLPRRLLTAQLVVIAALGVLHAIVTWAPAGTFHRFVFTLFNVDYEMNLPTWFNSAQLLLLALVLAVTAWASGRVGESRLRRFGWSLCACGALFLSADEVATIHERLGTVFEEVLSEAPRDSLLHGVLAFRSYYWIVIYAPLAVPVAIGLTWFVWKQLRAERGALVLGLFTYLYAAIGLDFIEGRFGTPQHRRLPMTIGGRSFQFDIFLMEELLEMVGVALVLYAFARHLLRMGSVPEGTDSIT